MIAINIGVFILWQVKGTSPYMVDNFLVSWDGLEDGRWWTLINSVFSHNWGIHILVNMIVLRDFGGFLERVLGSRFFLIFYLLAGAFSSFCHAFVSYWFLNSPGLPALGASGAISGLVMLFSLMFPQRKIALLGLVSMPAIWGALLFVAIDLAGLVWQGQGGGLPIGHGAHLGGAFAGALTYFLVIRPRAKFRQL